MGSSFMIISFMVIVCSLYVAVSFKSPPIRSPKISHTRLFRKIYHNDDGTFDVTTAPKLDFNENYYRYAIYCMTHVFYNNNYYSYS